MCIRKGTEGSNPSLSAILPVSELEKTGAEWEQNEICRGLFCNPSAHDAAYPQNRGAHKECPELLGEEGTVGYRAIADEHVLGGPAASELSSIETFVLVSMDDLREWAALKRSRAWAAAANAYLARRQSLCRWLSPEMHHQMRQAEKAVA